MVSMKMLYIFKIVCILIYIVHEIGLQNKILKKEMARKITWDNNINSQLDETIIIIILLLIISISSTCFGW